MFLGFISKKNLDCAKRFGSTSFSLSLLMYIFKPFLTIVLSSPRYLIWSSPLSISPECVSPFPQEDPSYSILSPPRWRIDAVACILTPPWVSILQCPISILEILNTFTSAHMHISNLHTYMQTGFTQTCMLKCSCICMQRWKTDLTPWRTPPAPPPGLNSSMSSLRSQMPYQRIEKFILEHPRTAALKMIKLCLWLNIITQGLQYPYLKFALAWGR